MLEAMLAGKRKKVNDRLMLVSDAIPLTDTLISTMNPGVFQMQRVGNALYMMPYNQNQVNAPIFQWDTTNKRFVEVPFTNYPYSSRYRGRLFVVDGKLGHLHNYVMNGSVYGFMMKESVRIDTDAFKGIANQMGSGVNVGSVLASQDSGKLRFGYYSVNGSQPILIVIECSVTSGISNANIILQRTATFNGMTTWMGVSQWYHKVAGMFFLFDNGRFYQAPLSPTATPMELPSFPGSIKPLSVVGWNKPVLGDRLYFMDAGGAVYYYDVWAATWNFVETIPEFTRFAGGSYAEALNDTQIIYHPGLVTPARTMSKDVYIYTPPV